MAAGTATTPTGWQTERFWIRRVAVALVPGMLAARLLTPQYRFGAPDPVVARVATVRAWLGFALTAAVYVRYFRRTGADGIADALQNDLPQLFLVRSIGIPVLGAAALLVFGAVLVAAADPAQRALTRRQLVAPARSVALFAGIPAVAFGFTALTRMAADVPGWRLVRLDGGLGVRVLSVLGAVAGAWAVGFVLVGMWCVVLYAFSAADGHPLLPPLVSMWLVWMFALDDTVLHWTAGGTEPVSSSVAATLTLGGCVLVSALALWEIERLRTLRGVTWRSGPRGSMPGGSPPVSPR